MTASKQDLIQYTEWLRSRIERQGDMDPIGESEHMVTEYLLLDAPKPVHVESCVFCRQGEKPEHHSPMTRSEARFYGIELKEDHRS